MPFPNPDSQFKPGQSGNPRGRPKGRTLGTVLRDVLAEEAKLQGRQPGHGVSNRELLIRQLFDEAVKTKDAALLRLIFSYHDGKPPDMPESDADDESGASIDPTTARGILDAANGSEGPTDGPTE